MTSPLSKVPLLLVGAICVRISVTPPNPPALADEQRYYSDENGRPKDFLSRFIPITCGISWITSTVMALSEVYVILGTHYPSLRSSSILSFPLPTPSIAQAHYIGITPSFLLGISLIYAGTLLRVLCYHHLGRYFTFQLSVRKEHQLIMSGPYAYVRHPSYVGSAMVFLGVIISEMGSGSWWAECGLWGSGLPWRVFGMCWVLFLLAMSYMLLSRIPTEDKVLRSQFKEQWDEWAKKTPYRAFPFIY